MGKCTEPETLNQQVPGSTPGRPTKQIKHLEFEDSRCFFVFNLFVQPLYNFFVQYPKLGFPGILYPADRLDILDRPLITESLDSLDPIRAIVVRAGPGMERIFYNRVGYRYLLLG